VQSEISGTLLSALCSLPLLSAAMRLDQFLKLSRLCPRRTLAQQLCDAGLVLLNGRSAKPGHAVKVGDEIAVRQRRRETSVRILNVPDNANVSRRDAGGLVEVLSEKQLESVEQTERGTGVRP